MNSVAQESPISITLATLTGLIVFILALVISFFAIYILVQTGQSILGNITYTSIGWALSVKRSAWCVVRKFYTSRITF